MEDWKKQLYICWLVMFIHMSGMAMILPFLPLYIKELGVTDPKALSVWSGIVFGVSFLVSGSLSPMWGNLSDKYGRKAIILRSTFGICVVCALMSCVTNVYQLLFLRIMHGFFGGVVQAFIALASEKIPKEKTGHGLGILQTSMIMGGVLGPLMGGVLSDHIGYRAVLLLIAILTFSAGLLTIFFLTETKKIRTVKTKITDNIKLVLSSKHLMAITAVQFVLSFSLMMVQPILPLFIQALAHSKNVGTLIGIIFAATGLTTMLFTPIWGRIGDKKGHKNILSQSLLIMSIVYVPQAIVMSVWQLLPIRIIIGVFAAGIVPSINTIIVKNTPENRRGGVLGITNSFSLFGNALGPMIGGSMAAVFGIRFSFVITASLLFLTWYFSRKVFKETDRPGGIIQSE